jgi:hypothetical protein
MNVLTLYFVHMHNNGLMVVLTMKSVHFFINNIIHGLRAAMFINNMALSIFIKKLTVPNL